MKTFATLLLVSAFATQALGHGDHDKNLFDKARSHVQAGKVVLVKNAVEENVRTPAYVAYDMSTDTCKFHTNNVDNYEFLKDRVFHEFMYYHELGHCDFYFGGHFLKSSAANNAMEAEMLTFQEDTYFTFLVLHEIYADAFAYAYMVKDGWSKKELSKILVWRAKGAWISNHKTSDMLSKLESMDWASMEESAIKSEIKALIDPYFMENYIMKKFPYHVTDRETAERSLKSELKNFKTSIVSYIDGTIKYPSESNYYKLLINMIGDGVKRPEAYPVFSQAGSMYRELVNVRQQAK